ncbi:MAG: glycosyltransferase family 4 protein [Prevotella sp.]|nr:glycosyltransferase family 4 protein [Prevotella sp.]
MARTKVLEVIRQGQIGGGESHLADLIELMDKTDYEPVCLSFTDGEMMNRLRVNGVKCYIIKTTKPFNVSIQRRIIQIIKDESVTIIHAHGTRAASNVLYPSRHLGLPLVYTVHGWSFHDDQGKLTYTLRRWSEKLICHYATRVICVSEGNAETGRKAFGLKNPIVIKNGVNLNTFNRDKKSPLQRSDFGFSDSDFVVGFIARCTKQKAPLDYLEAVRLAHQSVSSVKGMFIGEGDMDTEVDKYISAYQMESYVYRSPFRTDVADILPLIDVYCLPSIWEGLSIGLLEAMASGCAIIATPTDGTQEIIRDEQNGLIVPFNSPNKTCDAILRLVNDEKLRNRCRQNAVCLVAEQFNAQRVADAVVDIYKNIFYNDNQ